MNTKRLDKAAQLCDTCVPCALGAVPDILSPGPLAMHNQVKHAKQRNPEPVPARYYEMPPQVVEQPVAAQGALASRTEEGHLR